MRLNSILVVAVLILTFATVMMVAGCPQKKAETKNGIMQPGAAPIADTSKMGAPGATSQPAPAQRSAPAQPAAPAGN